jgi:hypothetical protein
VPKTAAADSIESAAFKDNELIRLARRRLTSIAGHELTKALL